MMNTMKAVGVVALAAMGLTLSACGNDANAGATAKATPDAADVTAASLDSETPAPVPAPTGSESTAP